MDTMQTLQTIIDTGSQRNFHPDYIRALVVAAPVLGEWTQQIADPDYRLVVELLDKNFNATQLKNLADLLKYAGFDGVVHEGYGGVEADSPEELIAECFLFNMRECGCYFEMLLDLLEAGFIDRATFKAYKLEEAEAAA